MAAHGYELIIAAADPAHPEHADALAAIRDTYGDDIELAESPVTPFSLGEINDTLRQLGPADDRPHSELAWDLPEPLESMVAKTRTTTARRQLRQLISDALAEPPVIDAATATRMVRPYSWLLDRVGTGGVTLTAAGYLPPAHVEAAMTELNLGSEWIGTGNRESQTIPVLHLRESATRMGLLRKYRGRLLVTSRGRVAAGDPVALWRQITERLPLRLGPEYETQASLLYLILIAASAPGDLDEPGEPIASFLHDIGWRSADRTPLTAYMASQATWDTARLLRRLGAITAERGSFGADRVTVEGIALAKAALQTWPAKP
ncbi:MAG: hypothetical protein ACRDNZ_12035 [Streptosporangiaceae bacterium]